ncbi:SUF system Fe-S cluster assembly regulator [Acidomonas methanolica]|uniref:Transcriptional regulator BadM/Rrf30 n=1 Tax=Acidomonas methanolica NBRC 104435 TaxID=1231351 RepID=A0A023D5K9_ACIMT|nr:SUF system Fe-S cluster assembly regulator [Acidomonas methanolica]MBU2653146.1 SUF system Fe-S cluster assembly regulator [Acidomonas methanolica]MCQ9154633.1 SUF system Fe-S cluster assembly regulator [Acidomonas methanolica]TCS32095.1 BadM/Rrf2 family transcriptional regulator [Acidomonas methanolica]GAJ29427.1 transcriptional regulator BadM/Rrf30 [Acidomonas methanolica NBRC 104435]GEK97528.1 transcriptional regulator [Acidomonas methanolica NBRC 104435]
MLRLSRLADYATVLLVQLGRHEGLATATTLSAETGVPEPTVAKLLKGLAADGLVMSHRGARGGYRLGRPLTEISVAAVIESVDGPIAITTCVEGKSCDASSLCVLSGQWDAVNEAIFETLNGISLARMGQGRGMISARAHAPAIAEGNL